MTKYDLTQPLKNIKGEPIAINEAGDLKPLGDLIADALLTDVQEEKADPKTKIKRFRLAEKVMAASGPVELSPKEITEIDECCGKVLSTLAFGQIAAVLGTIEDA